MRYLIIYTKQKNTILQIYTKRKKSNHNRVENQAAFGYHDVTEKLHKQV